MYKITFNNTSHPTDNALRLHLDNYRFSKKIFWWHHEGQNILSEQFNLKYLVESLTSNGFFVLDLSADSHLNQYLNINTPSFQQVNQLFLEYKIPLEQLILLTPTPDTLFKRLMSTGYNQNPSNTSFKHKYKHIFYNRFFLDVTDNIKRRSPVSWASLPFSNKKDIQKHFLSLSRKDTLPRRFLNYLLHNENLFDYGLVSHKRIKEDPFNFHDDELLLQDKDFIKQHIKQKVKYATYGYKKHFLDNEFTTKCAMNVENYSFHSLMSSKVFFELVNESWPFVNNTLFISEKLLKSIFAKNIFIVFGNPYTLRFLRSLGFKTFSHIFDESYDEKINTKQRVESLIKLLHNLVSLPISDCKKIYDETQEILDYNYNHLMKSKWYFQIHKKIENYLIERSLHD